MKKGLNARIIKTLGIFSGLESVLILCSVVKMKLVALWLGTVGVGLFGIFNTTVETVTTLTGLGLRQSSVKDVAQTSANPGKNALTIALVRLWSGMAGSFGALVLLAISPLLSTLLFGYASLWWQFAILAAAILFNAVTDGEKAVLQGVGKLKKLARATLFSALGGLAVSVPMFRYLGDDSVVLSILAYSLLTGLFFLVGRHKPAEKVKVSREVVRENSGFVKLGSYMALAAFITSLVQLVFTGWLNRTASTEELGLYQAGYVIIVRYVGLFFVAVAVEYFPRLSTHAASRIRSSLFVSHEIGLLLTLLVPCILAFLVCREWVVELLYTRQFLPVIPFITLAILGTIPRTVSTCMAYTILARGDGRTYAVTETLDSCIGLGLNILCYSLWGLTGLGLAYILWYLIYCLIISVIYFRKYHLHLRRRTLLTIAAASFTALAALAVVELLPFWLSTGVILLAFVALLPRAVAAFRRRRR